VKSNFQKCFFKLFKLNPKPNDLIMNKLLLLFFYKL